MFLDELFYNGLYKNVSDQCKVWDCHWRSLENLRAPWKDSGHSLQPGQEQYATFFSCLSSLADILLSPQLPEQKQRFIRLEERYYSQLELLEDNHTNAHKHIKTIWDFIMCCECCCPDVLGIIIQYRMLMMADQSSEHNSFKTPSLQIRHVSEIANV